jgi:hypothetical protein
MRTLILVVMAVGLTLGAAAKGDPVVTTPPSPIVGGAYYYPGIMFSVRSQNASVDLNGDRQADLSGSVLPYIEMGHLGGADINLQPLTGVELVQEATAGAPGGEVVAPLGPDTIIGPDSAWGQGGAVLGNYTGFEEPQHHYGDPAWFQTGPTYAGFRLASRGSTYYGWVQVDFRGGYLPPPPYPPGSFPASIAGMTIYKWAMETSPATPITTPAPEPGSAWLILIAAAGGLQRRRAPAP